jgi:hypothetical protein
VYLPLRYFGLLFFFHGWNIFIPDHNHFFCVCAGNGSGVQTIHVDDAIVRKFGGASNANVDSSSTENKETMVNRDKVLATSIKEKLFIYIYF